jgi:lipopolysaccharide/colanic/teichoic acid biosynthesis glycosyltransferase
LTKSEYILKSTFDHVFGSLGLILASPVIVIAYIAASIDTGESGFFRQERVGRGGKLFTVLKIRTMVSAYGGTVTVRGDPRITKLGSVLRKLKIDELPQLFNVAIGDMSFVGPRPDVVGFADRLVGRDRSVLKLKPGITGPATLKYRDEEAILSAVADPEAYNEEKIYPDKVRINLEYYERWSFIDDLRYIYRTIFG